MIGETLGGKYEIIRKIGGGGMGSVYEARHNGTGRRVAVKVITGEFAKNQTLLTRFQREAMASGAIETQHIVQVLDTGTDAASGLPFMVMELLTGEDLAAVLERLGVLPPELALRITAQACIGLQKAHDASVVHRDIKPGNLFLSKRDDGELILKLLDFGIAKIKLDRAQQLEASGLTRTGHVLGSPLYMSPEQARGNKNIDHRTDIWSLGVVLYQMLTGRRPHEDIDGLGELIIAICSDPPRPVQDFAPWVPRDVAALVHGALLFDPAQRYASAAHLLDAVKRHLPGGWSITEQMLVPLSEEERRVVAPRFELRVQSGIHPTYRAADPSMAAGLEPTVPEAPIPLGTTPIPGPTPSSETIAVPGYASVPPGASMPPGASVPPSASMPPGASVPPSASMPPGTSMLPGASMPPDASALPGGPAGGESQELSDTPAAGRASGARSQDAGPGETAAADAPAAAQARGTPGRASPRVAARAAMALIASAAAAFGLLRWLAPQPAEQAGVTKPSPPPATMESTPPQAISAPQPSAVVPEQAPQRTVKLVLVPPDVTAEVDGQPVQAHNGVIDVRGPLGSVHRVRLTLGELELTGDVTVTDSGASPPKLELSEDNAARAGAAPAPSSRASGEARRPPPRTAQEPRPAAGPSGGRTMP